MTPGAAGGGPRGWSVRTWLLVTVPVAVVATLVVTLLSPWGLPGRGPDAVVLPLPDAVAGLERRDGSASRQADELADRLRADPAVAGVAVGAYDGQALSVVVLRLSPSRPFDDQTAGRLTAQVLDAAGGAGSASDRSRQATSEDGEALLTCTAPGTASTTCVAVQSREAVLVLMSGDVADPLALLARVRTDVGAG